jgi:molybdenum cofactor cytidylyltransferase
MRIAGLYMAAGSSRRMGIPKLEASLAPGVTLGEAALQEMLGSGLVASVKVVARVDDELSWMPEGLAVGSSRLSVVRCKEAHSGMAASLKCGLKTLEEEAPDAVLVVLGDQPFVTRQWLKRLIKCHEEEEAAEFTASGSRKTGAVMPPALMSRDMCRAVLPRLQGEKGAGAYFSSGEFKGTVLWTTESSCVLHDVDDLESLKQAQAWWKDRSAREGRGLVEGSFSRESSNGRGIEIAGRC